MTPVYLTVGLAGAGIGFYRYSTGSATAESPKDRQHVFVGGEQGFVDLKLANVETLSHNTKRFRFEFDDKEAVSGLTVACECGLEKREGREFMQSVFLTVLV